MEVKRKKYKETTSVLKHGRLQSALKQMYVLVCVGVVTVGAFVPWCICGDQRTTLAIDLHLAPCLR